MKKIIITSILALLATVVTTVQAQGRPDEYLGLPGDNLNLYAVMNLFQESETLEGFERKLNEEKSRINNLDLNGDNLVDYIMVTDYADGEDHTIVLSVALNSNEKQDVAAFTVQRLRNGKVQVQLIGDEAIYGRNYIIEPIYNDNYNETPNPGYTGRTIVRTTTFEIAAWPVIRFIYHPSYTIWHSRWYWGYYPSYWSPWSPYYYHYYYGYHSNWYPVYYRHYRHWHQPRHTCYNNYYSSNRSYSNQVSRRISEGKYQATYSRPGQRRDGEALYARTNSAKDARSVTNSRSVNNVNRTISKSSRELSARSNSNSNPNKSRSTDVYSDRSGKNSTGERNTERSGSINNSRSKSTDAVKSRVNPSSVEYSGKSGTNSTGERNTERSRSIANSRSKSTDAIKSRVNPSSVKNSGNKGGSSVTRSERSVSSPKAANRNETVSRSGQSGSRATSSNRSEDRGGKSSPALKGSSKTREVEPAKSTRRK
jgi:hypothetical protein